MRDICTELECCQRCGPNWARRRAKMEAMHARLTVWSAWLAGGALVVCAIRVAAAPLFV